MANKKLSPDQARQILHRNARQPSGGRGAEPGEGAWRTRIQSYAPGETVLRADALSGGPALVVQGQLAVYAGQRRAERPLLVLTPGQTLGRNAPLPLPADATFRALTPCEIWFREPATAEERADPGRPGAGAVGARCSVPLLVAVLAVAILLALSPTRAALAALPMSLGDWCSQQGSEWCARQAWTAAGWMDPHDASAALALGILAFRQGDMAAAERAFERARTVEPDSPEAYNNLGAVHYRRGEYDRAAAAFEQALVLEPGSAPAQRNLGDSLLAMGLYDEALRHYQVAVGLAEPSAEILANMAMALYQTGRPADAERALEEALARADDKALRDRIGHTLETLRAAAGDAGRP